jgi:hypothetical protein
VFTSAPRSQVLPHQTSDESTLDLVDGTLLAPDLGHHTDDDSVCQIVEREGAYHAERPLLGISDAPNELWEGNSEGSESSDDSEGSDTDQEGGRDEEDKGGPNSMDVVE